VAREEWDEKGLYVNWWEAEPRVLQMPWALKTLWHDRMRGLVEDWIGGIELVQEKRDHKTPHHRHRPPTPKHRVHLHKCKWS
jgi:hypothetical protein